MRFAVLHAGCAVVNVLHKESPVVETDKQGAVCKKQEKGYYEAFRLYSKTW